MTLTKEYVAKVFSLLEQGNLDEYFEKYVAESVQWTITGTNVLSGTYNSRQDFINNVIAKVKSSLVGGIKMIIHHIYVDGDTAIIEMEAIATAKNGHPYNNQYVWIQKFRDGKIITARVYYDDVLVNQTIECVSYS
jgi:ketosteroid isomerase-like protein